MGDKDSYKKEETMGLVSQWAKSLAKVYDSLEVQDSDEISEGMAAIIDSSFLLDIL